MANSKNGTPSPAAIPVPADDPIPPAETEALKPAVEILRPLLRDPDQASQAVVRIATAVQHFRGPLPPPEHFKGYDDVLPGSAQDILNMAKREQAHRHRMQFLEMAYPYLGWFAGFVGFLACIAGSAYLAMHDHENVALAMLGLPVLGVIGWFVRSRLPSVAQPTPPAPAGRGKAVATRPRKRRV